MFHRKGHRQHHTLEAVPYLPLAVKARQDHELRLSETLARHAAAERQRLAEAATLDDQQRHVAARLIQSVYRAKRDRVAGKAYMKMVRQTHRMVAQRRKDDLVRQHFMYKVKKTLGVASVLASDTPDEAEAIFERKALVRHVLGLPAEVDHTKGSRCEHDHGCCTDVPIVMRCVFRESYVT
jgi:hypothetical protein